MDTKSEISIVGLPWYQPETFGQSMALMRDGERLIKSHEAWLRAALITERNFKAQGKKVIRATIEPEAFSARCQPHKPGLHIDAEARLQFASWVAKNHASGI